jgi:hypothetical protein
MKLQQSGLSSSLSSKEKVSNAGTRPLFNQFNSQKLEKGNQEPTPFIEVAQFFACCLSSTNRLGLCAYTINDSFNVHGYSGTLGKAAEAVDLEGTSNPTELEIAAAGTVKLVIRPDAYERTNSKGSLQHILDLMEVKTVWHPKRPLICQNLH